MQKPEPKSTDISLQITTPSRRYPPVGRCIYCRAHSNNLKLEHIVPFGLAGNALLLPKASCTRCESITGGFEQTCLRTIFGRFRIRIGAPTRNPKDRPKTLDLVRVRRESTGSFTTLSVEEIPSQEFPLAFIGLRLRPAGILEGLPPSPNVNGELWSRLSDQDMERFKTGGNQEGIFLGKFKPIVFARLLAKIAHAYAIAEMGFGSFRPLVTDLILGETDTLSVWVGGDWDIPPATPDGIYELACNIVTAQGKRFVVVTLRLFSFFGTPKYHVVVGELPDAPD